MSFRKNTLLNPARVFKARGIPLFYYSLLFRHLRYASGTPLQEAKIAESADIAEFNLSKISSSNNSCYRPSVKNGCPILPNVLIFFAKKLSAILPPCIKCLITNFKIHHNLHYFDKLVLVNIRNIISVKFYYSFL